MNEDMNVYTNLRDRNLAGEGLCIGEGRFVVERMIDAPAMSVVSVLCTPPLEGHFTSLARGRFPVIVASGRVIATLAGFQFHRGVLAAAHRPAPVALDEYLHTRPDSSRIAVCSAISDVENLGSIVRSARAFGFDALVLGHGSCDPFNRKAVRSSAGSCFYLPVIWSGITEAAGLLREHGFTIIGTTPDPRTLPIDDFERCPVNQRETNPETNRPEHPFTGKNRYALVFGHEWSGLSEGERSLCDREVRIPIDPAADSLNVGVAAGVFFHYFGKYRQCGRTHPSGAMERIS